MAGSQLGSTLNQLNERIRFPMMKTARIMNRTGALVAAAAVAALALPAQAHAAAVACGGGV